MDPTDIARWQFAITTVYHFLFVPITIGLSAIVAGYETAWLRTGHVRWLRLTKFFGKLFLINFAIGVVTGIVQEFQFGMNWSDYSRFVGDIFGAPLAIEALVAFFLESTFLGLWIFGWDKLPRKLHLASIWLASIGTMFSAYFILVANSWMQHPVGYRLHKQADGTVRAELTDIWHVLTQNTALVAFFHTMAACFLTAGAFMAGIAAYHLMRRRHTDTMRPSLRLALVVTTVAGLLVAISGDLAGKVMYEQQPMKMASAEALWDTSKPAPFSVFSYGDVQAGRNKVAIEVPGALSFLAKDSFTAELPGINDINKAEQEAFGPGDYRPVIPVTYWSFRLMIGIGMTSFAVGAIGLWLTRRKLWINPYRTPPADGTTELWLTRTRRITGQRANAWAWRVAVLTLAFPLIGNSFGWIFTEMGRQPWAVYGVLKTESAVSPNVSAGTLLFSLIVFTLLYGVLAVVEVRLLLKYAKAGPLAEEPPSTEPTLRGGGRSGGAGSDGEDADRPMAFAY